MQLCRASRRALPRRRRRGFRLGQHAARSRAPPARAIPRLVVIILRGALDGLSAVAPIGDPEYAALHGELALRWDGAHPALALDGFFGLNPAMPNFARLYGARQAIVVHAAATNYRERSHFDGQDVLESGMPTPGSHRQRLAQPGDRGAAERRAHAERRRARRRRRAAAGAARPGADPRLGAGGAAGAGRRSDRAIRRALRPYATPLSARRCARPRRRSMASAHGRDERRRGGDIGQMRKTAQGAARLIGADGGPRIAALAFDGWDTHVNEGGATGRLAQLLGGLDGALAAFESRDGPAWKDTVVSRSPNSAAPPTSTAPPAPTTARARWPSSPAAHSQAGASSPTGRA